jgi:hypothetical protein
MRAVQVAKPNALLEMVERQMAKPGAREAHQRMLSGKARFRVVIPRTPSRRMTGAFPSPLVGEVREGGSNQDSLRHLPPSARL